MKRVAAGLLGAVAGLGLLLPGAATALPLEAAAVLPPSQQQQELAAVSAVSTAAEQQDAGGLSSPLACYMVASDLSAAPDLVTDAEVEAAAAASSQLCAGVNALEATLVNGLGWVVEEAQEVTNFTENNFAAVG